MIHRPVTIETHDGELIRGDVRTREGSTPESAVVVVHGFKGFKDWGFFPHVCERLAEAGHAVVSFNFSRNGIGTDPLAFTELDAFGKNTFSRDIDEILRVVREVRSGSVLPVPPERIGVFGHSRGGGEAVVAVSEDPGVDALVTWASVAVFGRWPPEVREEWRRDGRIYVANARTGQDMPLDVTLLDDFENNADRLDIEAAAARLQGRPWLIVHGEEDRSVGIGDGERLASANPDAVFERIPGADHAFEARHPFAGSTPELDAAVRLTLDHFGEYLDTHGSRPRNGEDGEPARSTNG